MLIMHASKNVRIKRLETQFKKAVKLSNLITNISIAKFINKKDDTYIGKLTCKELNFLGPTFVKIGQFISTRSDIFGKPFTEELKSLQDKVSPMPQEDIATLIEHLNESTDNAFEYINHEPMAAASIGQVHYARIKPKPSQSEEEGVGQEVVIKFKRMDIDTIIKDDFSMLLGIIDFLKMFVQHRQIQELEISLKEYYKLLQEEIDYVQEVNNMKQFRQQFQNVGWIKVPRPFDAYCTNDVIVMEYVPAIKIDDVAQLENYGLKKEVIAQKLLECFFTQIVQYGFVHIDPHPGNVGIIPSGKIVFYDYGMFVNLNGIMKENIKDLFLAMYDRDVDEICELLLKYEIILLEDSKKAYFKKFIASFLQYLDKMDINDFKISYLDKIDQSEMQFMISSKFIMLLRGISILEGICKLLYPQFNYRDILDPFISDFVMDIQYMERKGKKDFQKLTETTSRITTSEISLNMMESDMQTMKQKMNSSFEKQRVFICILAALLYWQSTSFEMQSVATVAFLYILYNK